MKTKGLAVLLTLLMSVCLVFSAGCSSKPTLNVLNWGDYMDESIIAQFEEEYGIKINYIPVSSNEEMYVAVSTEDSNYDLVIPSDYMVERLIKEEKLLKINYDNIPNAKNLDTAFLNQDYDPGNLYSVPYTWGTLGILYNNTLVSKPVSSWDILWDEDYAGNIYMYDSMRDSIGAALMRLGYNLNTRDESEIAAAVDALKQQKKLVKSYGSDEMRDSMIGGSGALCLTYSGDAVYCMTENEDLAYCVPDEGSNLWFDSIVVLKTCKNVEAAEKFINFRLDPQIAAVNTEYIGYSTPNAKALELIDETYLTNNAFNPASDVVSRCIVFHDLGDFTEVYSDAWQQVKLFKP